MFSQIPIMERLCRSQLRAAMRALVDVSESDARAVCAMTTSSTASTTRSTVAPWSSCKSDPTRVPQATPSDLHRPPPRAPGRPRDEHRRGRGLPRHRPDRGPEPKRKILVVEDDRTAAPGAHLQPRPRGLRRGQRGRRGAGAGRRPRPAPRPHPARPHAARDERPRSSAHPAPGGRDARSSWCRPRAKKSTGWWASRSGPTTTCPSRSAAPSCWPGSRRSSGVTGGRGRGRGQRRGPRLGIDPGRCRSSRGHRR